MEILILIVIVLAFLLPMAGITVAIYLVIKKSTEKKSASFLAGEKQEMISDVLANCDALEPWKPEMLEKVSNHMNYSFKKTLKRENSGSIFTADGDHIIEYKMIDRGLYRDCTIVAYTSENQFVIRGSKTDLKIYIDDRLLGTILNDKIIQDPNSKTIGKISRHEAEFGFYKFLIHGSVVAEIKENTERRSSLFNRRHKMHRQSSLDDEITIDREVEYHDSMVTLLREPTELERQWVLGFTIFDLVYHSIDFTQ